MEFNIFISNNVVTNYTLTLLHSFFIWNDDSHDSLHSLLFSYIFFFLKNDYANDLKLVVVERHYHQSLPTSFNVDTLYKKKMYQLFIYAYHTFNMQCRLRYIISKTHRKIGKTCFCNDFNFFNSFNCAFSCCIFMPLCTNSIIITPMIIQQLLVA